MAHIKKQTISAGKNWMN